MKEHLGNGGEEGHLKAFELLGCPLLDHSIKATKSTAVGGAVQRGKGGARARRAASTPHELLFLEIRDNREKVVKLA